MSSKQRRELNECLGSAAHLLYMAEAGKSYTARKSYPKVDGIAVIDASGVLVNDEGWWDGWGASSYERITGEVRGAMENPEVEGILLRVNSPGGETSNAFETADAIAAAAKQKPVWGVADVAAYSAGYLLLSATDRIYVPKTSGGAGSIGVYSEHWDYSDMLEEKGIKVTLVSAGKGKTDGHPAKPLSPSAKAKFQEEVDRLYMAFVGAVAKRRRMSEASIIEMGAATKHGAAEIIATGLADKTGSFEDSLQQFRAYLDGRKAPPNSIFIHTTKHTGAELTAGFIVGSLSVAGKETASATNSPEEVSPTMDETNTQAAADATKTIAAVTTPSNPAPTAAPAQTDSGRAEAEEIAALCTIAGCPNRIAEFLGSKKSAAAVRSELLAAKAASSDEGGEVHSQVSPSAGTKQTGGGEALLAAVQKLGKGN